MNTSSQPANRATVRAYLVHHYGKTEEEAAVAVTAHAGIVADAERFGSWAYFAGDKIASLLGWVELDGVTDAEDDEEEA